MEELDTAVGKNLRRVKCRKRSHLRGGKPKKKNLKIHVPAKFWRGLWEGAWLKRSEGTPQVTEK